MKPIRMYSILFVSFLVALPACSGNRPLFKNKSEIAHKFEQAYQTVNLALSYYDQGDLERSGDLFTKAADLYMETGEKDLERRALVAAAISQIKCSQTRNYHVTASRLKGLMDNSRMPADEIQFLVNLSDQMQMRPLSYPVQRSWRVVFGYQ